MQKQARVVVIGGGVVGCSVLYHLARFGWTDCLLIERSELTSGSTWHAAGGFHTLNGDTNMAALQGYTIRLYRELEEVSGQSCGLHHVGGLTLAETPERMDFLRAERAKHRYMGLDTRIVLPGEIEEISPITNTDGILGALYDPLDGHLDPSGTTHAYATAARKLGAEIMLRNPVLGLKPLQNGRGWMVETGQGEVEAEHVVIAAGLWAREVGRLASIELPLHPMEHQYLVTDDLPEVFDRNDPLISGTNCYRTSSNASGMHLNWRTAATRCLSEPVLKLLLTARLLLHQTATRWLGRCPASLACGVRQQ